ncbi:MAG: GNAT family N-acetyltransferase [Rhizobiaceae bacterium]
MKFRSATIEDAGHFVRVFEEASHGLSQYLWQKRAGAHGDSKKVARDSVIKRISSAPAGSIFVIEVDGQVAGGVITNAIGGEPEEIDVQCDPAIVPLIELENSALNTHYINAVAVFQGFRGQGVGTALLREVERRFPNVDLSLIVLDNNKSARRIYQREGYEVKESAPVSKTGWKTDAQACLLMIKEAQEGRA